jgi:hypothetical protein
MYTKIELGSISEQAAAHPQFPENADEVYGKKPERSNSPANPSHAFLPRIAGVRVPRRNWPQVAGLWKWR